MNQGDLSENGLFQGERPAPSVSWGGARSKNPFGKIRSISPSEGLFRARLSPHPACGAGLASFRT